MRQFDDAQLTVLDKLGNALKAELEAAADPKPGKHNVDFLVHVKGEFTKGEDVEKVVAQAAKPWLLLAVALSKLNGVTVESIVKEAVALPDELEKEIKAKAETAMATIKAPTRKVTKGAVKLGKGFEVKLVAVAGDAVNEAEAV